MTDFGAWTPAPSTALAVLLIAGHFLADFLFQKREDVQAKRHGSGSIRHGSIVLATHAALVAPLLSGPVVIAVAAVTLAHVVIDWVKSHYLSPLMSPLTAFTLDQAAHLLAVGGVWKATVTWAPPTSLSGLEPSTLGTIAIVALFAAAFAFNGSGGSIIVEGVLRHLNAEAIEDDAAGVAGAGRLIGILERTLVLVLILYQQWAAMAILVTAKSIARFEELKIRRFAEYYLVGTLSSLLVALGIAFLLTKLVLPLAT